MTARVTASLRAFNRRLVPRPPTGARVCTSGPRPYRRRVLAGAQRRFVGQNAAYQQPPPGPPGESYRRSQTAADKRSEIDKEPFDAELLVLFGLPALVLIIAFAANDPKSLAVALPLALIIPGPRDVLLHVGADLFRAARRARRFVSAEDAEYIERQKQYRSQQQEQLRWRQQPQWGRAAPPPPPPPPPPPAAAVYEVAVDEYDVYQPPAYAPPQQAPPADVWPAGNPGSSSPNGTWQQQQQGQAAPQSPFANGWPAANPGASKAGGTWQQGQAAPQSPFANGWPTAQAGSGGAWQQQAQGATHSPFADGWPAASPASDYNSDGGTYYQHTRRPQRSPYADEWPAPRSGDGGSSPQGGWQQPPPAHRRRASRGGGSPGAVAAPSSRSGRLVRPASKGRVGVDLRQERSTAPLLLRPLFALVPFMRSWGGFL